MLITLLGLNQKSGTGIFHHLIGAAVLDLEGLNGEHDQSIAQVPSIRHVSSGVPHRDLIEFWEIPGFPIHSVFGNQAFPKVFPLRVQNLLVKGELPTLLPFDQAKREFVFDQLAGQFIAKTVPAYGTFDQPSVPFLIDLDKASLSQLIQNNFPGITHLEICIDKTGVWRRHTGRFRKRGNDSRKQKKDEKKQRRLKSHTGKSVSAFIQSERIIYALQSKQGIGRDQDRISLPPSAILI